jgi:hypothetical protein
MNNFVTVRGISTVNDIDNENTLCVYAISYENGDLDYEIAFYSDTDAEWMPAGHYEDSRLLKLLKENEKLYDALISKISGGASREVYFIDDNAEF